MWKQLPSGIWTAAWVLAFIAGAVNVVGLLGFEHQALTHLTGLTSKLAEAIAQSNAADIGTVSLVIASFVGGAVLSGLIFSDGALERGGGYSIALSIEAALLGIAALLLKHDMAVGFSIAAISAGLQNAMVSNYSGSTIRTTHVSGMFTDLGISIGHMLRGRPVNFIRIRICLSTITGFLCGGIVGVTLFQRFGTDTLYLPAGLAALFAARWGKLSKSDS